MPFCNVHPDIDLAVRHVGFADYARPPRGVNVPHFGLVCALWAVDLHRLEVAIAVIEIDVQLWRRVLVQMHFARENIQTAALVEVGHFQTMRMTETLVEYVHLREFRSLAP